MWSPKSQQVSRDLYLLSCLHYLNNSIIFHNTGMVCSVLLQWAEVWLRSQWFLHPTLFMTLCKQCLETYYTHSLFKQCRKYAFGSMTKQLSIGNCSPSVSTWSEMRVASSQADYQSSVGTHGQLLTHTDAIGCCRLWMSVVFARVKRPTACQGRVKPRKARRRSGLTCVPNKM